MSLAGVFLFAAFAFLKVESQTPENCNQPLGIADGRVTDSQLTASSIFKIYGAHRARLNLISSPPGYRANPWRSGNRAAWIQVEFLRDLLVSGIATQGYGDPSIQEWVTLYKIRYQIDARWLYMNTIFTGNNDSSSIQRHDFPHPVEASKIVIEPLAWNKNIALRMELYGCEPEYNLYVKLLIYDTIFTVDHANTSSATHKTLKRKATSRIRGMLKGTPGYISADFHRFGPYSFPRAFVSQLMVEMKIQHQKNYSQSVFHKIRYEAPMQFFFKPLFLQAQIPYNYNCPPPYVSLNLSKTLEQAQVHFTTDSNIFYAQVKLPFCRRNLVTNNSWEVAEADLNSKSKEFYSFMETGLNHELPSFDLRQSFPTDSYLYISYVLRRRFDGRVLSYDYGYVLLLEPPPPVKIIGPIRVVKGQGSVVLNASLFALYEPIRISYRWYCRRSNERFPEGDSRLVDVPKDSFRHSGGCYGYGPGKLSGIGSRLSVNVDKMEAGQSYVFRVIVSRYQKQSIADHVIVVHLPTNFSIQCTYNCGPRVVTNKRMVIESKCAGPFCPIITKYIWSMYQMETTRQRNTWEKVQNLDALILSKPNGPNFVLAGTIGENVTSLEPKGSYRVSVEVFVGTEKVLEDDLMFETNSPPYTDNVAGCSITPPEGISLLTNFLFNCSGWYDEDLPLSFVFSYISTNGMPLSIKSGSQSPILRTILPQGKASNDFNVTLKVEIFDALGTFSVDISTVKVKPVNNSPSDGGNEIGSLVDDTLARLFEEEEVGQLAATATIFLDSIQNSALPESNQDVVKDVVLAQMADVKVKSFLEIGALSSVITMATDDREEMPLSTTENTVVLLKSMTNYVLENVDNIRNFARDAVQSVGENVLQGFSNAISSSSRRAAQATGVTGNTNEKETNIQDSEKAKNLTQDALLLIDKLGSALLSTKVIGEKPTTFTSGSITMVLDRQPPSDIANMSLRGSGHMGEVVLPSEKTLFGTNKSTPASIDAQMLLLEQNPYTWGKNSENIASSVIQFDLKMENGTMLNISDLPDPFQLFLPNKNETKGSNQTPKRYMFVKGNNKLRYHVVNITNDAETAFIEVRPQNDAIFDVFVRSGVRPTPEKYNFSTRLPDFSSCMHYQANSGFSNCTGNPYIFTLTSTLTGKTGLHFIGIRLSGNSTERFTNKEPRTRRRNAKSCTDGTGRQKRSCVGVKEPPTTPPPTPIVIIPKYNASADVNYTMSVTLSSCLYWSEKKQIWTNEGCKVGPKTNNTQLHCLCTHLSAFGGNIFVAPNPIDFDKVWKEFGRLSESKNYVVLLTVCAIVGIYFIGLVLARRVDKKDHLKVVANVLLSDRETSGYRYKISIQTGMWSGFGTTAEVGMIITGENGESGVISLVQLGKTWKLFARASVNNFSLCLPASLGKLTSLCVWHDNSGQHPAWFLQQIVIYDEQTEDQSFFFVNQWLAVDKGRGEIEINVKVAEGKDLTAFKPLFFSRAARSLGEGHLWISVFARPPHNPFTRCQRLSCCLSFLFTAMVTNAMFYQFGRELTDTFKFGPLVMSWTQIKIGIQSSVIAIPVNVLVVIIFRNIKQESSSDLYDAQRNSTSSGRLPPFFVYIGWSLCILISLTGALFTIFYSMQWGAEISNEWLTSILVSLVQDVLISQPVKVILFAFLLSLIIKKPPEQDVVFGPSFFNRSKVSRRKGSPLKRQELETVREYSVKLRKAFEATKEIIYFLIFAFLLFVICYGNQDPARYHVTKAINDVFSDFGEVVDTHSLWEWITDVLVPGIYDVTWYNGQPFDYNEGFISHREGVILGMPRLRQLRIRFKSACPTDMFGLHLSDEFSRCLPAYSTDKEDRTPFSLPGWIPLTNHSAVHFPKELCPKPWRYQSDKETRSLPQPGDLDTYDGGGYVADLGYNMESAFGVIADLKANKWINEQTVVLFIEFTVFNPSSSLFSVVRGIYEKLPVGTAIAEVDVKTFALYPSSDVNFQSFYEVCQLLFLIFLVACFIAQMVRFIREKGYHRQLWSWVDLALLVTSLVAVVMSFLKNKYTSLYVKEVQKNPFATASSDYIVLWSYHEMFWLAMAIFILTLKLLRLIRFNYHVCQMEGTLKRSVRPVISFAFLFAIALVAFSFFSFLAFGSNTSIFSSVYMAFRTNLLMSIGKQIDYVEIYELNSPVDMVYLVFYFIYILCVLINIFVAALVDSYAEVRENQGDNFANAILGNFMFFRFLKTIRGLPTTFMAGVKYLLHSKDGKRKYKLKGRRRIQWKEGSKAKGKQSKFSSVVLEARMEERELVPLEPSIETSEKRRLKSSRNEAENIIEFSELIEDYYLNDIRKCLAELAVEMRSDFASPFYC